MIDVTIYKNSSDNYQGFMFNGHAGAAGYGKDIVCAAVSVLVINTVNSLEAFTAEPFSLENDSSGGYLKLEFEHNELSKEAGILMDPMVLGLQGIRDNGNKKYIRIIFKEV